MSGVFAIAGVAVMLWIASTTRAGRRLRARLGFGGSAGQAPRDDRDYLLRVCGDDPQRVARLLDQARGNVPDMTEAEAYRRAIRMHLRDRT